MDEPDLNRVCETFIKLSDEAIINGEYLKIIQTKLHPLILELKDKEIINWYSFLIHNRESGVPIPEGEEDAPHFHIRVGLNETINYEDFKDSLPDYCRLTREINPGDVQGVNKDFLKIEEDAEAWRIFGELSEFLMNMISSHKEDLPRVNYYNNILQLLHFWFNITQFPIPAKCPNCQTKFNNSV